MNPLSSTHTHTNTERGTQTKPKQKHCQPRTQNRKVTRCVGKKGVPFFPDITMCCILIKRCR